MKYVDEFRSAQLVAKLVEALEKRVKKPWTIMEVCGGQTHSIMKFGLHELLPKSLELIHGPGCPVCVTPTELIDHAIFIGEQKGLVLATYGDMLRVPGSKTSLLTAKAKGADVRTIYSPLEAVEIARNEPDKQVVFFAVGFETTAAPNAMAIYQAKRLGLKNFSCLASHVLVPPALRFLLAAPDNRVQGFLAAGHVCTVTGYQEYHDIAATYNTPMVVTGFEPVDILQGLLLLVNQLERNEASVTNQYSRSVLEAGNRGARKVLDEVFEVVDREWRGIGMIPQSGLGLKDGYRQFDAALRYPMASKQYAVENGCISGLILQGKKRPSECPYFGKECRPEHPLGAPMVSSEGACSSYYEARSEA